MKTTESLLTKSKGSTIPEKENPTLSKRVTKTLDWLKSKPFKISMTSPKKKQSLTTMTTDIEKAYQT